jgi:hypothetical protein
MELMAPNSEINPLFQETMAVPQAPASAITARAPVAAVGNAQKPYREVIEIADSGSDSTTPGTQQPAGPPSVANPVAIKSEPTDLFSDTSVSGITIKQEKELLTKRAKVDAALVTAELLRLREEDEREEEELLAAQRVADLIRKRNQRKAKIAETEARSSPS